MSRTILACVLFLVSLELSAANTPRPPAEAASYPADIPAHRIVAVPSFDACSLYVRQTADDERLNVEFRQAKTTPWQHGLDLVRPPGNKVFRGSILGLREGTVYEVRVRRSQKNAPGKTLSTRFRTWTSEVPIAETHDVRTAIRNGILIIRDRGKPGGWVRYTAPKGFVLRGPKEGAPAVLVENARYIILEGLTIRGGGRYAVHLRQSDFVRIVNCDIADWGRVGKQDFSRLGKYRDAKGKTINYDGAVYVDASGRVVIERCYIHDPRGRANSWCYSHPSGPEAVMVHSTGGLVLRYNDFIGSDPHRWNDVIESENNGSPTGGFYRDGDVYGNALLFGNDDGIELDGGQMNLRVHHNHFEGTLCGISTAPCLLGPSYLFRNMIVDLGDENGRSFAAFKNNYSRPGYGRIFVFNNTSVTPSSLGFSGYDESPARYDVLKAVLRNNLFVTRIPFAAGVFRWSNDVDFDLVWAGTAAETKEVRKKLHALGFEAHGKFARPEFIDPSAGDYRLVSGSPENHAGTVVPGIAVARPSGPMPRLGAFESGRVETLPFRPIPLRVFPHRVHLDVPAHGTPPEQIVTARIVGSDSFHAGFRIRKNDVFDWFDVSPTAGVVAPGKAVRLTIRFHAERMPRPMLYRGAFLVRLASGFSRVVTLYADKRNTPFIPPKHTGGTIYLEAEHPATPTRFATREDSTASANACLVLDPAKGPNASADYAFTVPRSGPYLVFARIRRDAPGSLSTAVRLSVDGAPPKQAAMVWCSPQWGWALLACRGGWAPMHPFDFGKGRHTLRIQTDTRMLMDILAITDNPRVLFGY